MRLPLLLLLITPASLQLLLLLLALGGSLVRGRDSRLGLRLLLLLYGFRVLLLLGSTFASASRLAGLSGRGAGFCWLCKLVFIRRRCHSAAAAAAAACGQSP